MSQFLDLSEREKQILWDLFLGFSMPEIAARRGLTRCSLAARFSRTSAREGCRNTQCLLVRFIQEYLGVGEPFPAIAEPYDPVIARGAAA